MNPATPRELCGLYSGLCPPVDTVSSPCVRVPTPDLGVITSFTFPSVTERKRSLVVVVTSVSLIATVNRHLFLS